MTYYLIVGGKQQVQLATTRGWHDFKLWSQSLSAVEYPQLIHLIEHGWSQELDALANELKKALISSKPAVESIAATLEDFYYAVAYSGEAQSVFVSDSMGAEFATNE